MSPRRSSPLLLTTSSLLVAAGLLSGCGMPQPTEPAPPPQAESSWNPELYGGPVQDSDGDPTAPDSRPAEELAQGPGDPDNPYGDTTPAMAMAEASPADERRPGWGTMDPIPNPPAGAERERAYAEARPAPTPRAGEPRLPQPEERLGAYNRADAAPLPPVAYAERAPTPPQPYAAPEGARYAEGAPAASYPPVIVTMPPVPNPEPRRAAAPAPRAERAAVEPTRARQGAAPAPAPVRRQARAADDRLMGGPALPRAASRPAGRDTAPRAATATAPARPAAAGSTSGTTGRAAVPAARGSASTPARSNAAAALPPVNTPAGRAARLKQLEGTLRTLVERDSTLAAPTEFEPGRQERITLTLPQGLSDNLTREARTLGLRELASRAEARVQLRGEGWKIEPEEPQTDELRAGRVGSFTWTATPERGAGPLSATVEAALSGGGRFETLQLGQLTGEVTGPGSEGSNEGGLSWRALGLAVLLLAALLGALLYARRKDGGEGGQRRYNRRRPDPVNLTPYSPAANTDAPRDGDPEPVKP